jgi:hypothetical protein
VQNRDDVDGSQRPVTADAPDLSSPANDEDLSGHLGPRGSPSEGADGPQSAGTGHAGAPGSSDHLGPGGDAVEGDDAAIEHDLTSSVAGGPQNTPAKE